MENTEKLPRFRTKSHTMKSGKVHTYYLWDGRGRGIESVPLGKDREIALKLWADCEKGIFPTKSKPRNQVLKIAKTGKRRRVDGEDWIGAEAWVRTMYFNAERRAKLANRAFTLTPVDMLELVSAAGSACQISGIPFEKTKGRSPFAPSLDRIDSSVGYQKGNVRLVCHVANVSMNTWGIEPVLTLAKAIFASTLPHSLPHRGFDAT